MTAFNPTIRTIDPPAAGVEPAGGFRPVKVTYRWEEDGKAKEQVFVAKKGEETWTINCAAKPAMKSIVMELAE